MGQFNAVFEQITNEFSATFDTVIYSGDATLGDKTITANGVYNASADNLDGYSKVTANVPNTYTASDEGKVVDNGALVSQTSATYTSNDTYDTTKINSVTVNVSGGGGEDNTLVVTLYKDNNDEWYPTLTFAEILAAYTAGKTIVVDADGNSGAARADGEMHVEGGSTWFEYWVSRYVPNSSPIEIIEQGYSMYSGGGGIDEEQTYIVPTGTKSITANGQGIDVTNYAAVNVAVPNSYSAADEGKVVDNGALVAQTAHADVTPTTSDQTIDTTANNSIKVKGDADLIATNIKKDVEIFGVTGSYEGGGGGSDETGSFVAGSSQSNVTISVTALHSHVLLWDPTIESDDDISTAPYGTKKTLLTFADNNTGFVIYGGINSAGTGFTGQFSGIGRWGGNTAWNDRVEFTSSTIKIINPRVNGTAYPWIDGHTINWRAW